MSRSGANRTPWRFSPACSRGGPPARRSRSSIRNEDARSKDYAAIADTFRPGHADYTYWQKYGIRDYRGGGRQSARETAVRVAAGAVARKWLREHFAVVIRGHLTQLGPHRVPFKGWEHVDANPFFAANDEIIPEFEAFMDALRKSGDSCGARITVVAQQRAGGLGRAGCRQARCRHRARDDEHQRRQGVEIGAGFASVAQRGTEHSDEMTPQGFVSNNAGGILGGISTGQDVVVSIAVKPTSSIRLDRRSVDKAGNPVIVNTHGRHDACVGIRATPIAEAMLALVLIDHALRHRAQNADVECATPRLAAAAPDAAVARMPRLGRHRQPRSRRSLRRARHSSLGLAARELYAYGFADRNRARVLHDRSVRGSDDAVSALQHRLRTQVQQAPFERSRRCASAASCSRPARRQRSRVSPKAMLCRGAVRNSRTRSLPSGSNVLR